MNRLDATISRRTESRLAEANARSSGVISEATSTGIEIVLVGSLSNGTFREHSDIDYLVYGSFPKGRRGQIERLVARHMRGSDIPYDLIFEDDLTPEWLAEILGEHV